MTEDEARVIWRGAVERWLAEPGGSYAGLMGIMVGTIATSGHPELLVKAAGFADQAVSIERIVEETRSGRSDEHP